ncbi:MAG: DUF2845 domain-containing protein [Burkholderiales bacterium]|nr:DUF2845 domain-containing protein [Burkholderiales bacterium]
MKVAIAILLWALMMGTTSAAVYKCTDSGGKIEFSDSPCAQTSEPMVLHYDAGDPKAGALQTQVAMGQVTIGMTASQVRQAWGEPDGIKTSKKKNGAREEWSYRRDGQSQKVTLVNGEVTEVSKQTSSSASKSSAKNAAKTEKTSTAKKNTGKADERRFVREGMTTAEVRARIGAPDSRESGTCRERTMVNSKKQLKTTRDLCDNCWVYEPAEGDPQTRTQVCFQNGQVSSIERKVVR